MTPRLVKKASASVGIAFKPGDQIVYIPDHAEGNIFHPDVEFGFVTSVARDGSVFCRYWGKQELGELRTRANSEKTPRRCLFIYPTHDQEFVDQLLKEILSDGGEG